MRSAGLGHVGGLLPPQALTKLVHLRGHVLPGTGERETPGFSLTLALKTTDKTIPPSQTNNASSLSEYVLAQTTQEGSLKAN